MKKNIRFFTPYFNSKLYSTGIVLSDTGNTLEVKVLSGFMEGMTTHISKDCIVWLA
jgi:hypothetical protein